MTRLTWWILTCIGLLLGILLASHFSHAQQLSWPTHDRWGYELPRECRRDLSFVGAVVHLNQDLGYAPGKRKALGRWKGSDTPWGVIYIDKSVGDQLPEVLAHERCHALFNYLYGTPYWHMED